MSRKSKYDLVDVAYMKVPRSLYLQLKPHADKKNIQWAELVRDLIFDFLKQGVREE